MKDFSNDLGSSTSLWPSPSCATTMSDALQLDVMDGSRRMCKSDQSQPCRGGVIAMR